MGLLAKIKEKLKVFRGAGMFAKDIGIDLGTASILVYVKGKGVVLREPSVVAMDKDKGTLLKVGTDAQQMLGRTPGNIVAIRPLREGVISDFDMTERMLKEFIRKAASFRLFKPRVVICVPSGITEVEERAVVDAGIQAGARRVFLIEEPLAAAIGAGIDITKPDGHMVVDIGGGTTDIAVISLGGIVESTSIKIAGDQFDEAILGVLERTPPELVADISTTGIVMTGGGSLVWGFDKLIESHTGIETYVAEDAISCVAYGTGKSLEWVGEMQDGTMNISRRKQMN